MFKQKECARIGKILKKKKTKQICCTLTNAYAHNWLHPPSLPPYIYSFVTGTHKKKKLTKILLL